MNPQVILNSMHKFQPRVYLVKRREGETGPVQDIEKEKYRTFVFPETQFTAVTAYQNQLVSHFYRFTEKMHFLKTSPGTISIEPNSIFSRSQS